LSKHLTMARFLTIILSLTIGISAFGQKSDFALSIIENTRITGLPEVQSFVWGKDTLGRWLVIGGRTDGLHKRRPFESFLASGNNTVISVINPTKGTVKSAQLSDLPTAIFEQLQSTNMQFEQVGDILYIAGGYAYSSTAKDHVTFDRITTVEVNAVIEAISNGHPITSYFKTTKDQRLQVTGGYMDYLDGKFFLVGGQNFQGRYNPMGPGHGPGFTQTYSEEIKRFEIDLSTGSSVIKNYTAQKDTLNLHRRDYNMGAQIFPNGRRGFTAFSGVFQHNVDLPFLNCVDIDSSNYKVRNDFSQLLSQYHSAHLPVFDSSENEMSTVFFGGIAQYYIDANGETKEDQDVPFVKTISRVVRTSDDNLIELAYPFLMPDYLGSGAEFIPSNEEYFDDMGILHLSRLPGDKTLVGYIYGGIKSDVPNGFFSNSTLSKASSKVFEVYIDKTSTSVSEPVKQIGKLRFKVSPNPANYVLTLTLLDFNGESTKARLMNSDGEIVWRYNRFSVGSKVKLSTAALPEGIYFLQVGNKNENTTEKVVIAH